MSLAALRMMGIAAARTSFAGASALLRELAGLTLAPKTVERHAEALGREIAGDECRIIEPEPCDAPTVYLGLDGTGVPARKTEVEGRCGKQPDGSAKTREAKLVVVWSAQTTDNDGRPVRDPGSATYNAAIESIATRDTDTEPAPFAQRILREAERRGFDNAPRQVVLGDGAPWMGSIKIRGVKQRGRVLSDLGSARGKDRDTSSGTSPSACRRAPGFGSEASGAHRALTSASAGVLRSAFRRPH